MNQPALTKQKIRYRLQGGYSLSEPYSVYIPLKPNENISETDGFVTLYPDGMLSFLKGYTWDGPSVPFFVQVSPDSIRPSLIHDGLYQLMRQGKLDRKKNRKWVDKLFREHLIEDGMSKARAKLWYSAVNTFAAKSASAAAVRPILEAP